MGGGFSWRLLLARVAFLIDGFNVYHAINEVPAFHKYKWLDYSKLAKCFIGRDDEVVRILLFTAYTRWDDDKVRRRRTLVRAQQARGVEVVFGRFKLRDMRCRICKGTFKIPEEKLTDVNIAAHLFQLGCMDEFDKVVLVTGDNDLAPAIKAFKKVFPAKRVEVVLPMHRHAKQLKQTADLAHKLREHHLPTSQLEDVISLKSGSTLFRPKSWS